jgi:hypothetical protein
MILWGIFVVGLLAHHTLPALEHEEEILDGVRGDQDCASCAYRKQFYIFLTGADKAYKASSSLRRGHIEWKNISSEQVSPLWTQPAHFALSYNNLAVPLVGYASSITITIWEAELSLLPHKGKGRL